MVVDFHIHCYDRPLRAPESFVAFMDRELAKSHGSFAKFLERYGSAASYLRVLDEAGADYGVILAELAPITSAIASNETVEALCQGQPRLIPVASLNPYLTENPARELERLVREHGFRGLKLYPTYSYFYPNDPKLYPVYAKAQELGIPVKWHTGLRPNVYMEIAGLPPRRLLTYFPPRARQRQSALRLRLAERATMKGNIDAIRALALSEGAKERILGGNAARLLKLL